jgi:protein required for attachment to host cells
MAKMAATWVVVADRSVARLLAAATPMGPLEEFEVIEHPEGRMRAQALTSDLPGRAFDSKGRGRHALESEVGPRKHEAIDFARRVAARLAAGRTAGEVERIILVAAPEFLGLLRDALGGEVRKLVVAEYAQNVVSESAADIRRRLPERLYSTLEAG